MQNDKMTSRSASGRWRPAFVLLLMPLGLIVSVVIFGPSNWMLITSGTLGPRLVLFSLLACCTLAWLPPIHGPLNRLVAKLRRPSGVAQIWCSVAAGLFSTAYLWLTAIAEHRQFFPYIHDEFSYLIQAHQLARGRLWMPAHPLGPFFDSFQLFVKPVYASAYFPGTAVLYVPGIWLHLPPYVTSLMICGAVAGLLFWITTALIDAIAAALGVLLLLSDGMYREASLLTLGQMPLLLYALLATVGWLRWRATNRLAWLLLTGFFLGLAGVTRPVDALCFAIPIAIAAAVRNFRQSTAILIGAAPLLCMQLLLNHGITGQWLRTPFTMYADQDYPGTNYGFHRFDPTARPQSGLPQKQGLYTAYQPVLQQHQPKNILQDLLHPHGPFNGARLGWVLSQCTPEPFPLLLLVLPLSLAMMSKERGVLLATLPLFVLLYVPYVFFFPHYVLTTAPAVIVGILLGAKALSTTWDPRQRFAEIGLMLFIAVVTIAALPQWNPWPEDVFKADLLASVNQQLRDLVHRPAVVLFTYDPRRNTHEEPVYNADTAWPDDAEIIRAHDLGAQNPAIFDYYAVRQPQRYFYRFDERDRTMHPLGTAAELGHR